VRIANLRPRSYGLWLLFVVPLIALASTGAYASAQLGLLTLPFGMGSEPLASDRYYSVGDTVTSNGIAVSLEDVGYTSSETVLKFKVTGFSQKVGGSSDGIIPHQGTLTYTGVRPDRLRVATTRGGVDEVLLTITLGPVLTPGAEIAFEIGKIFVMDTDKKRDGWTDGPWAFRFTPPLIASDPINVDIPVGADKAAGSQSISLDNLHMSSSGIQAHYYLSAAPGFLGWEGSPARLILEDGTVIRGVNKLDPNKFEGDLRVDFDNVPANTTKATVSFGPFARELAGPFTLPIALPPRSNIIDDALPIKQRFTVAGETIEAVSLHTANDGFGITFSNVSDGSRTVIANTRGGMGLLVFDDIGNEYLPLDASWNLPDDERGASVAGSISLSFREPLDQRASLLTIVIPSLARLEYGPDFTVDLQP